MPVYDENARPLIPDEGPLVEPAIAQPCPEVHLATAVIATALKNRDRAWLDFDGDDPDYLTLGDCAGLLGQDETILRNRAVTALELGRVGARRRYRNEKRRRRRVEAE